MLGHACFDTLTVLKQNALPNQQACKYACSLRFHCPARRRAVFCVRLLWKGEGSQ